MGSEVEGMCGVGSQEEVPHALLFRGRLLHGRIVLDMLRSLQ